MRRELFFEIPDDESIMAQLVQAIPENWSWVDGQLHAPLALIATKRAQADTGFSIDRFHSIHPTIIGSTGPNATKNKPNLFAIMVEQKLPGFVSFHEAGFDANMITLENAKRIAVGFLRKGYRGELSFYKGCRGDNKYDNEARCSFAFESWHGAPCCDDEAGEQPARTHLEWDSGDENVALIAAVCWSLGLREYLPASNEECAPD